MHILLHSESATNPSTPAWRNGWGTFNRTSIERATHLFRQFPGKEQVWEKHANIGRGKQPSSVINASTKTIS